MATGCCYLGGDLREVVQERIAGKRLAQVYLNAALAGVDPDDLEV